MGLQFFAEALPFAPNRWPLADTEDFEQPASCDFSHQASKQQRPYSRADALTDIASCRTWAELFEAGNQALGFDRSAWGDDFSACAAALALWHRSAFIIEASSPIEMSPRSNGQALFCDPADAKRASFRSAQAMLTQLTSPLGSIGDLKRAAAKIKPEVEHQMRQLRMVLLKVASSVSNPTPKGEEINFLIGTAAWVSMSKIDELADQPFAKPCKGWSALAHQRGPDPRIKPKRTSRLERSEIEMAWRELLDAGSFAYVACGPMGGIAQGAQEALAVARATRALESELLRSGMPSAGLGGLGVSVNASPIGLYATGAFEPYRFNLVFKAPFRATALHHEWTHALERMVQKSGDKAALTALKVFENEMKNLSPDRQAFEAELLYSQNEIHMAQRSLMRIIAKRAKTPLPHAMRRAATIGSCHEFEKFATLNSQDLKWSRQEALRILSSYGLDHGETLPAEIAGPIGKLCTAHVFDSTLRMSWAQGTSSFISVAKALDKAGGVESGYWQDGSEIHARCGEARFSRLVPKNEKTAEGRLIVGSHMATSHPMGLERLEVSQAFDRLMQSCASMVKFAQEDRRNIYCEFTKSAQQPTNQTWQIQGQTSTCQPMHF